MRTTTKSEPARPDVLPDWKRVLDAISRNRDVAAYTASVNVIAEGTRRADPFRVLIATIISLRTRDEVTLPASERLFSAARDPEAIRALSTTRIEELIYPAGFYRNKAKTILEISRLLCDHHGGQVPSTVEELVSLPGVGLKTANLVLGLGFGIPAICVDTHVHRVANRMGWVSTTSPNQTSHDLEQILPQRYWIPINQWLVAFGREICTPGRPWCSRCPVYGDCRRVGVAGSR